MKKEKKGLYRNSVSYFGGLLILGSAILDLFAILVQVTADRPSPYLGIVTYLLLPAGISLGLAIFLFGMRRESVRRRRAETAEARPFPALDLNDPRQRRRFAYWLVGGSLLAILLSFAAYNGFAFTESVTFCGKVCHTPMEPELTTYLNSPHSRVKCVECHVGSGADWYVKAKISGVRQVYAVIAETYERPIPVPIKDLRPARETCEHCHWPEKFYGAQLIQNPHFRYDEKNTAEQISVVVKTGGGSRGLGSRAGIHWHMTIDNKVSYVAFDRELQNIAILRVRRSDGTQAEYINSAVKLPEGGGQPERVMDCMDCHNRPTHHIQTPDSAIDQALAYNLISPKLPWVKKVAVEALLESYPDRESARTGIRERIAEYYRTKYPAQSVTAAREIDEAIKTSIKIHERNVFPKMKVNWSTYPSNIGHRNWPGCFRCHNGKFKTSTGTVLTTECSVCHTMPQRGPLTTLGVSIPEAYPDWHPWELKGQHKEILCHQCHAAGARTAGNCVNCHRISTAAPMMKTIACASCHVQPGKKPAETCGAPCHETLGGLHAKPAHKKADCVRCHQPHTWKSARETVCRACHDVPKQGEWK